MKTGWIVAGFVTVGGLIYLMMRSNKVTPGTNTVARTSNSNGLLGGIVGGVREALSGTSFNFNFGGGPQNATGRGGTGVGNPESYPYEGLDYGPGQISQGSTDPGGTVSGAGNYAPETSDNPFGTG